MTGNIKGYNEPLVVEYHTPISIDPTSQYLDRKAKFTKWLELSEYKQGEQTSKCENLGLSPMPLPLLEEIEITFVMKAYGTT